MGRLFKLAVLLCLCAFPAMAQRIVIITGGTVTANVTDSADFYVTLNQNVTGVTLTSTVTPATGYIVSMKFVQDATGSRTVVFGGNISTACAVNSTANSVTICRWQYTASSNAWADAAGGAAANSPLPAATSGPGPVFNVKNYGASGNSNISNNCTISGSTNLNCTDATFTSANIGQRVSCATAFTTILPVTTFSGFVNATNMTVASGSGNASGTCLWGTPDDTGVAAALAATLAAAVGIKQTSALSNSTAAPTLYFPAGTYNLLNTGINFNPASGGTSGFALIGDGLYASRVAWNTSASPVQAVAATGNVQQLRIENISFDGVNGQSTYSIGAVYSAASDLIIRNVMTERFSSVGLATQGTIYAHHLFTSANSGTGLSCTPCSGEVYESLFTNNTGAGIVINGAFGLNGGSGFRVVNSLADENTGGGGCDVQLTNSTDVWFQGFPIFSSTGGGLCGLSINPTSFLHYEGGIVGVFASEPSRGGVQISAGGVLQSSDVRYVSTGTQNCINNAGTFNDNGGNTCESMYVISSGTSTGTTAVLTLTTLGSNVNTNCTVGDALVVQGASIAGYNGSFPAGATSGITAVTATTLTYTTIGSNLGVLGAGGTAFCRNLQTYTGNLPKALLNNPIPNTCYVTITPIVNATTYTLCNFRTQSATNISRIMASSQNVTTCATAPIITISDGTATQTLTLTTAKQSWDSSVDASSGVGTTIFKPNGTITVKYDVAAASACATPPTQLAVSYNISPILSN